MQYLIREVINEGELKDILALLHNSFKPIAVELGLDEKKDPENAAFLSLADLKSSFQKKGSSFYVLEINQEKAGLIAFEKSNDSSDIFYITKLCVLPKYRHQKIGEKLLLHTFNTAQNQGLQEIYLYLINENTKLKKWYLSFGFKEIKTEKFQHYSLCYMKKSLIC